MSDKDEHDSNIINIFSRKKNQDQNSDIEAVMNLSDALDDTLNQYLEIGMAPDLVAAVLANRLGVLISAMNSAGISDPVQIYLDIVVDTVNIKP